MKYVVNSILDLIVNNAPSSNGEMMVRVDGFEDVKIYESLGKKLTKYYDNINLSINIKLAKNKWNYFLSNSKETSALQSLKQNRWIAESESVTHYRNLHESNILVLMGTEDEEDKGGLLNCYTITQDTIVNLLDGKFHEIFEGMTDYFSDSEIKSVNKLYSDLFEFVAIDVCKISDLADDWENKIFNIMDFIDLFYGSLPNWGLPFKKLEVPTIKDLNSNTNILRTEYNFINRQAFKRLTQSNYIKYDKRLNIYNENKEMYSENWVGWPNQGIKSYSEFSDVVLEFIRGENVVSNKKKILSTDFSITEAVLGITLPPDGVRPQTTTSLYGEPLIVFTKVLFYALSGIKLQNVEVEKICINISQAEILCMYSNIGNDDEKKQQLLDNWSNICRHTNGVIEYINNRYWVVNGNEISIELSQTDIFSPKKTVDNIELGIVKAASANKKQSRIDFQVKCYTSDDKNINQLNNNYRWLFEDTSTWLNNFSDICSQDFYEFENSNYIPVATISNINTFIFTKSEEEFFDLYDENNIDFSFNLSKYIDEKATGEAIEYSVLFDKLGSSFVKFIYDVANNGFYSCIEKNGSTLSVLVKEYIELGNHLLKKTLPENMKWVIEAFIHAFNIESSTDIIEYEEDAKCCIVPPWHPATLEKINDQKIFFLDGCKEWWETQKDNNNIRKTSIDNNINNLVQMTMIHSALDVFPSYGQQYFGIINSYGAFSVYARSDIENNYRLKDMIHKDAIYDDDFHSSELSQMNDNAKMIYGIIKDYLKAFPNSYSNLSIVFVDPSELQPIIAAFHKYIHNIQKDYPDSTIDINLKILVKPENKGGRNYLSYWMDEFFTQDDNVNIRMYLNEWNTQSDLDNLLNGNNDIVFIMDLLKANNLRFIKESESVSLNVSDCRFPIVYRPSPMSNTSVKRRIELSQTQFCAAYIHTQVVHFRNHLETLPDSKYIAVREARIDKIALDIVSSMHDKAYWVVCIDSGMDGALLRTDESHKKDEYSIIGFSTGKGSYGQYNLTITARKSILEIIEKKLESRFYQLFHWEVDKVKEAVRVCLDEASGLDGISLFSAINQNDHNINEFMAYILTSLREKSLQTKSVLKVIIHLDSYQHWFSNNVETGVNDTYTRPDFLILEVNLSDSGSLRLEGTVIECKISNEQYSRKHQEKAYEQVKHGINRLETIFNPKSRSIKRRYWYSQLYRALAFSQITFSDNSAEFSVLSSKLRSILDGGFEINWNGKILGFWLDMDGNEENVHDTEYERIKIYDIPQLCIQKLILQRGDSEIDFINIDNSAIVDEEIQAEQIFEREKEIENEIKELQKNKKITPSIQYDIEEVGDIRKVAEGTSGVNKPSITLIDSVDEKNQITEIENQDSTYAEPNTEIIKKDEDTTELTDIRVLLGTDKLSEKVYWEFGHKNLANRHVLITGTSGQGKTYAIQTMLYELSEYNVSSVVFDYTEGFRPDQLETRFVDSMGDKIIQHIVYSSGVPINPFKRHEIEISGITLLEKTSDVALRIANIFKHVYDFGEQQFSAIFEAARIGLKKYGEEMNMHHFKEELENIKSSNTAAKTVLSKMAPFFYSIEFTDDKDFDWGEILYSDNAALNIFQLTLIDREMQVIITELMLWDAWYYTKKYGNKDKPFVVVLDEAQNLSHKTNSPSASILTEGRKFGWSAWFATQSLKILSDEEVVRLLQSAFKLYFKPTDDEVVKISKQLDPTNGNAWLSSIKRLNKGQCIIVGDRLKQDGKFGLVQHTVTIITSFEERE